MCDRGLQIDGPNSVLRAFFWPWDYIYVINARDVVIL